MIDEKEIYEKMYGTKVCTTKLNIEGFDEPLEFDIYDGHAVCFKDGKRYDMEYPMMEAIKDSKEISDVILDYVKGITADEISPLHSLMAFNKLYIDGVLVKVD